MYFLHQLLIKMKFHLGFMFQRLFVVKIDRKIQSIEILFDKLMSFKDCKLKVLEYVEISKELVLQFVKF